MSKHSKANYNQTYILPIIENIHTVFFDLDGVVVDFEPLHIQAKRKESQLPDIWFNDNNAIRSYDRKRLPLPLPPLFI
jgi:FMN phosphatase YigB (HAD superfamily)